MGKSKLVYKNLSQGIYYFIIHALVELICFTILGQYFTQDGALLFTIAILFDIFAFVTQGFIGEINHRYKTLDIGTIGVVMMFIGVMAIVDKTSVIGLIILALGNAMLHEAGAISTTILSDGKLFHSALFVSGGSFGLVIGQTLGKTSMSKYWLLIPLVIIEILVLISNKRWLKSDVTYPKFDIVKQNDTDMSNGTYWLIICLSAFIITFSRSFIGYAIPISWKKELWQTFLLFIMMGAGKALGGYLSDKFGAYRTGVLSTLICIPFLIFGKDMMIISIFGVFCFSLTMSITFGMLLSIIPDNPGLAFGVTTIGLFMGLVPVFIFGNFGFWINIILILLLSLLSAYILHKYLKV